MWDVSVYKLVANGVGRINVRVCGEQARVSGSLCLFIGHISKFPLRVTAEVSCTQHN
jgi:hypothetical protein